MIDVYPRKVTQFVVLRFVGRIPTTNTIWRSYQGRNIKSKKYRDWIVAAGKELEAQKPGCVVGPFGIRIALANSCRLDCDNAIKPIVDLLRAHNVIEGDSKKYMRKVEAYYSKHNESLVWVTSTKGADDADI